MLTQPKMPGRRRHAFSNGAAKRTGTSGSQVAVAGSSGNATRGTSSTDQRMVIITLTDKGVDYTLERLGKSAEAGTRLLAPLSAAEQALLLELLQRISDD